MTTPDGLTAAREALLERLGFLLRGDSWHTENMLDIGYRVDSIAREAVARHVRDTGCDGLREALLDGVRSWHADAPVPGVATLTIDFGGDRSALAKVVTRINALAPTVAASEEVPWKHYGVQPGCTHECHYTGWNTSGECCAECWVEPTPSPATEAERQGGE